MNGIQKPKARPAIGDQIDNNSKIHGQKRWHGPIIVDSFLHQNQEFLNEAFLDTNTNTMFSKLTTYFKSTSSPTCLSEMDGLYKDTISGFDKEHRIAYCQRLIRRTQYDLKMTEEKHKKKALKTLMTVAEKEISNLRP